MTKNDIAIISREGRVLPLHSVEATPRIAEARVENRGWRYETTLGGMKYEIIPTRCRGDYRVVRDDGTGVKTYVAGIKNARKLVTWLALYHGDIEDDSEAR